MGRRLNTKAGDIIDKVTIVGRAGSVQNGQHVVATWNVKCECGKEWTARSPHVRNARQRGNWQCRSCSNSMRDKHGIKNHYLKVTWRQMVQRCYNKKATSYKNYGGRGIDIYHEWLADPSLFVKWCDNVLGQRPDGHTLDRIDNNRGYHPDNLRWADAITQNNNQSR